MKTLFLTFASAFALCAALPASAQTSTLQSAPQADTVLLSETVDSNYRIRRYRITRPADSVYTVQYRINAATLDPALDRNNRELKLLGDALSRLMQDTTMHLRSIAVTGYASPDGPYAFNARLARNRALNFKNYIERRFRLSGKGYRITTEGIVDTWENARSWTVNTGVPDRTAVLEVMSSTADAPAKQQRLEKMTAAWDYLRRDVLPSMRRVEAIVEFESSYLATDRTPMQPVIPIIEEVVETVVEEPCPPIDPNDPCGFWIEEEINGMIVEMPGEDY